jgi:hypothetical protein
MAKNDRRFLYRRLTYKYRLGWAHEDRWERIGEIRILQAYTEKALDKYGDGVSRAFLVKVFGLKDSPETRQAISDHFAFGCSCEHDCCGHGFSYGADVTRAKRNEYIARQYVGRNV